jgi:hypothetical protein
VDTQELDDQTNDDDVLAYRAKAKGMLDQIVRQVKVALKEDGIDLDVFVMIPSSGDSIATFGTASDPDDALWSRVSVIVCGIVRQTVGLQCTRCREVVCATTADHQPIAASQPVPMQQSEVACQ